MLAYLGKHCNTEPNHRQNRFFHQPCSDVGLGRVYNLSHSCGAVKRSSDEVRKSQLAKHGLRGRSLTSLPNPLSASREGDSTGLIPLSTGWRGVRGEVNRFATPDLKSVLSKSAWAKIGPLGERPTLVLFSKPLCYNRERCAYPDARTLAISALNGRRG